MKVRRPPPHPFRRSWRYVEYDLFFKDVDTSTLPPLCFAPWVPSAVADEARKIYAECLNKDNPVEATEPLLKIISSVGMKKVWDELYRKSKSDGSFLHPIRFSVTEEEQQIAIRDLMELEEYKGLCEVVIDCYRRMSRWSDQDLGIQNLLWHIYHDALNIDPEYFSDIQAAREALRQAAHNLASVSSSLRSKIPAFRINKAVSECLWQANTLDIDPKTDNAWIIVRDRGINDARLRTFVAHATSSMRTALGKEMCGTVATLANVLFDRNDINKKMVEEMTRLPRSRVPAEGKK
jgi:hypothetical protein